MNVAKIREDFQILNRKVRDGKQLIYLDNAATTQKPKPVINAICNYYMQYNANVHRAVYQLAEEATAAYESARDKVASFINGSREEIIFVRNATEAINLVAYAWGKKNVMENDKIVITELEHHSNLVPWQLLAQEKNAELKYVRVDDSGIVIDDLLEILNIGRVKLVSVAHMSNLLGTITPLEEIIKTCHEKEIPVMVDGAQSVPHLPVDVRKLNCDFMAFSAHKMLGPTGVGVLYAKKHYLENMAPFISGGDMIKEVQKYKTAWNDLPWKYEAGTSNIADVIGYGAAIDYLNEIGMQNVRNHEKEITKYALERMADIKELHIYGTKNIDNKGGIISFNFENAHPHDLAVLLDRDGIAIRSGHHCAQVLTAKLGVSATARASFYVYNSEDEIDIFINSLHKAKKILKA
ncbi:cysteine desulfurase [Candidatus Pacearchaeota archaeon]|nr:cysteine desulfurase [Candidatus Pacearchaeota archaeon]